MVTYTLKVVEIIQETLDTVTLCFKQPGLKKVKYLPGQYLTLVFKINGRKYIRPYSFSSAPNVNATLNVTVKRVQGGIVSNHINDFVKIDDAIEVIPPMGDFVFNTENVNPNMHIILWGAGSGITPLFAIAKYILHHNTGNKVKLVYGNRNSNAVIFKNEILELEKKYPHEFKTWHFHTQLNIVEGYNHIIEGRINPDLVLTVLKSEINLSNTIHYICGPTGLKESVKNILKKLDVPDNQVFFEDFEVQLNEADFENINTQIVEIQKQGILSKVEVTKGKSILTAGLDALIDLDYACQTGSCLLCRAKVLEGSFKIIGVKEISDKLQTDECLLCCTYPLSSNLKVSVY